MIDVSKLNKSQIELAKKIGQEAINQGVDPSLAIATAFAENNLTNGPESTKGAIGPMQVMPANAQAFGYKPEDLKDPDININVGIGLLKQALDRYKGNAHAALVEYNASPTVAAKYVNSKYDPSVLPDETKQYLQKIHENRDLTNSGFLEHTEHAPEIPVPPEEKEPVGAELKREAETKNAEAVENPAANAASESKFNPADLTRSVDVQGNLTPIAKIGAAGVGALAATPVRNMATRLGAPMPDWYSGNAPSKSTLQTLEDQLRLAKLNQANPTSSDVLTRILQGTTENGATGVAREHGYSLGGEQARAELAAKQQAIAAKLRLNPNIATELPTMTSSPMGILAPPEAVGDLANKNVVNELTQKIQSLKSQLPSSPSTALGKAGIMIDRLLGPIATPLAGAATGLSVADAWNRYQHGDKSGAVMSALEAAFGGMSMLPPVTPLTAAAKGAGVIGGLGLAGIRALMPTEKQTPITNQEVSNLGLPM